MEPTREERSVIEKLKKQILRGHRFLEKPEVKAGIIKMWSASVRNLLKPIYGRDSAPFKEFNPRLIIQTDTNYRDTLKNLIERIERFVQIIEGAWSTSDRTHKKGSGINKVFIGHGRNPIWRSVHSFIEHELNFGVEAFETQSHISSHIVDALSDFLENCDVAVIVMAGDDYTAGGSVRARQNVVHEIGLFQGR